MKPVLLKLAGLHSFREVQTVDFEKLGEAGLFGIFGPTGSGKSTILDAITLALYGQVERAGSRNQGIMNHAEERVLVEFTFELLTPEGKKRYRAERLYRRTGDNSVSHSAARLVEIDGAGERVVAEKSRVTGAVMDILGLSPEDFTRAVVLPQGKFAEFLSLRPRERRQMLQRLFNLQEYGDRFAGKLKNRLDKTRIERENVLGEKEGMGDASDRAVAAAAEKLAAAREQVRGARINKEQAENLFGEFKQIWDWQAELAGVMDLLRELEERRQFIHSCEEKLETARRAERVMPVLADYRQAEETHKEAGALLGNSRLQLEGAAAAYKKASERLAQAVAARQRQEPLLLEKRAQLLQAEKYESECRSLDGQCSEISEEGNAKLGEKKRLVEKLEQLIAARAVREAELDEYKIEIKNCFVPPELRRRVAEANAALKSYIVSGKELEDAGAALKQKENEFKAAAEQLKAAEESAGLGEKSLGEALSREKALLENCPARGEELHRAAEELERLRSRVEAYLKYRVEMEQSAAGAARAGKEFADLALEAERAAENLALAVKREQEARERVEELRKAIEESRHKSASYRLARLLEAGEPCPVCGSHSHPFPATLNGEDRLPGLERELDEALERESLLQREVETARAKDSAAAMKSAGAGERLGAAEKLKEQKQEQCERAAGELPPGWGVLSREELLDEMAAGEADYARRRQALLEWERALQKAGDNIRDVQHGFNEARIEAARAEESLRTSSAALEEARTRYDARLAETSAVKDALEQARGEIPLQRIEHEQRRIEFRDARGIELNSLRDEAEAGLMVLSRQIEECAGQKNSIIVEISELREKSEALKKQLSEKQGQLTAITGGRTVGQMFAEAEKGLEELYRCEREAGEEEERARGDRGIKEQSVAAAASAFSVAAGSLETGRDKLNKIMAETGFITFPQVKDSLLDARESEFMSRAVAEHRNRWQDLNSQRVRLEERLGGRKLSSEEWARWQDRLADCRREYELALLEQGAVEREYNRIEGGNARWKQLESRGKELEETLGRLEILEKMFRGNAFVEYLAEEQLTTVAREASARLGKITRYRYALEVDSEGGFIMRDDGNGGVKRPVSSLSGGEIFITSLSLALALSAQLQLKGSYPLEFFFLDEGFGTLDPELLETVMTALEQLRLERLTIGVISHVPELKNRMPRRLVVKPAQLSGEGSRLVFEMA